MKLKPKYIIKLAILMIIAIIITFGTFYLINIDNVTTTNDVVLNIAPGSSTKTIAAVLANNGIIKNAPAFIYYAKTKNVSTDLKSGTYTFDSGNITFDDIIKKLLKGGADENSVNVTIPEGLTIVQIAELLSNKNIVNKDTFLETASNMAIPYNYISSEINYTRLEGFLFPETYNLPLKHSDEEIINILLSQFDKVWTDDYQKRADELNLTVNEVITIASLIEREAKVDSDRPLISSVIHNRLKIDMPLQIDATIQYSLGKQKSRLSYTDLEIESEYNSYTHKGLPPTPIAAPGEDCIKAALYPADTDYFYYRVKKSGSGEHIFSKTFEEHVNNK